MRKNPDTVGLDWLKLIGLIRFMSVAITKKILPVTHNAMESAVRPEYVPLVTYQISCIVVIIIGPYPVTWYR